jgi:histidyl-tRNA synthetase
MADKKPSKLKARLPRGLADRAAGEIAATRAMVEAIRAQFERYGFEALETPAIEYTDALGKFLPDQDRPNEGVFSFQDDDEQWLSLRYDLTAPLARYVADNIGKENFVLPYRSYRYGWVFRNEKPGPGRFRQFLQFDADTVGSGSMAADAEMCMLAADTMEALGIPRGQYVVKVNNRKVLDGVMEAIGIGGDANATKRLTVLRAIDKMDRLGRDGVRLLLGHGRWDGGEEGKGDFTKGAELNEEQITRLLTSYMGTSFRSGSVNSIALANARGEPTIDIYNERTLPNDSMTLDFWRDAVKGSAIGESGVKEVEEIAKLCRSANYGSGRIVFDSSVVRGLEYYTGPVYEVELLLETNDDKGRAVRFGSVGGGGRYDGLVSRFRGEPCPATGFSIGVSRLQAALTLIGKLNAKPQLGPVVVTVFDKDRVADYQRMVAKLRAANIRAELYLGNPKNLGNQLKYADKRNAPCVVIQGGDEKAKGEVTIKDLRLGAELAKMEKTRDDYLQQQAQAQLTVPVEQLVETVRAVMARQTGGG